MKNLVALVLLLAISIKTQAQSPQQFSYQAVLRDSKSNLILNQAISVRCSLIQGMVQGSQIYIETHNVSTNENGLLTLVVGGGTVVDGSLSEVNWNEGPYFLKTEIDPAGGQNYILTVTSQLLSVPFAMHAHTADTIISRSGKGLSSEDFTKEARNKLDSIDGSETHLEAGKGAIIEGKGTKQSPYKIGVKEQVSAIPVLSSSEIDTIKNVFGGKLVFNKSIQALQVYVDSIPGFSLSQEDGGSELSVRPGYMRSQTFSLDTSNHRYFYFRFYVSKLNSMGSLEVQLREASPTGSLVLSKTMNVFNIGWQSALLVAPKNLKTGTYAINLVSSTADLMIDNSSNNPYKNGSMYFLYGSSATSGTWSITNGYDMRFKIETPGQNTGWKVIHMSE